MGDDDIALSLVLAYTAGMVYRRRTQSRPRPALRRPSHRVLNLLRLSPLERRALIVALDGLDAQVYVFGSRTDREGRGGDVDILVIPRAAEFSDYRISQDVAVSFQRVCEEKVDVVVLPREMNENQRAFFRSVNKIRVR